MADLNYLGSLGFGRRATLGNTLPAIVANYLRGVVFK
jgi:hypothetical protein